MTAILQGKHISKEFGDKVILNDINFEIESGKKIGIVGSNGAGKTTLADIITNTVKPTSGQLLWQYSGMDIGYMKQATEYLDLEQTLSGGERTKKLLTQLLYSKKDFLVLDEPTNHLDYEGVKWLIKQIRAFKGAVVIISHDRFFLDQCIDSIMEIDQGKIINYNGNYSFYREEKWRRYESQLHLFMEQEKLKSQIRGQIEELKGWSEKAHRESRKKAIATGNKFGGKEYNRVKAKKMDKAVKSRIKRLEKIEVGGLIKPEEEIKVLFQLEATKKVGDTILQAKDIRKFYGNKLIFSQSSFYVKRGEKIGVYGVNGCGKSTLVKAILKQVPLEGEIRISEERKIGYISQDVLDIKEEKSILQVFEATNKEERQIRMALVQMGFSNDRLYDKAEVLSLGERMKLKLLLLIRQGCEVLILDEPTNHIDLHVREQLEETLKDYNGTLILVTHDRYMLEQLCDKLLVFENQIIRRYEYGIREYLERKEQKQVAQDEAYRKEMKSNKEDKMLLENEIAYIIGQLSREKQGTPMYEELDNKYQELIKKRNGF
ncbi:ABC-F family ATP-binding cassette domain-containing protein [Cellulosilyticum sp. ST5]|uniref:ribosomal protection-like ABC-F family protein n=1 Tax=Cellulosilyticum sp. ST5 TaxID=3055805 RepID=UPI0039773931